MHINYMFTQISQFTLRVEFLWFHGILLLCMKAYSAYTLCRLRHSTLKYFILLNRERERTLDCVGISKIWCSLRQNPTKRIFNFYFIDYSGEKFSYYFHHALEEFSQACYFAGDSIIFLQIKFHRLSVIWVYWLRSNFLYFPFWWVHASNLWH